MADCVPSAKPYAFGAPLDCGCDDERRRLAGEYGAAEFITKPVDFDFLKTKLRDLFAAADCRMAASKLSQAPT
jgi:hypothetical protein